MRNRRQRSWRDYDQRRAQRKWRKYQHCRRARRQWRSRPQQRPERDETYAPVRLAHILRNPVCEVSGCTRKAVQVHHKRGREGENLYIDLMSVCAPCHTWIHRNEDEAKQLGYLLDADGVKSG